MGDAHDHRRWRYVVKRQGLDRRGGQSSFVRPHHASVERRHYFDLRGTFLPRPRQQLYQVVLGQASHFVETIANNRGSFGPIRLDAANDSGRQTRLHLRAIVLQIGRLNRLELD